MKLKEYLRSIGCTLTVEYVARLEGYANGSSLHIKYADGKLEELKTMALDAEARFQAACKVRGKEKQ